MRPGGSRTSERSFLFISKRQATGVAGMPIALLAAAAAGTGDDLICPGGKDGGGSADPKATEAANPIAYIGKNSAPMLLMHGTADKVVSPGQTDLLYQALKAKGVPAERYEIPGAAHGGVYWIQDNVLQVIGDFFDRYLK